MTKIVDTAINVTSRTSTHVELLLGVDTRFTGSDLTDGQSGAAKFEMHCSIYDDDTFSDDHITGYTVRMEPASIQALTGVNMPFTLSLTSLRSKEPPYESTIELYGEFTLHKNGRKLGPSVKTRNKDVELPGIPPPTTSSGQHITVSSEGSGAGTIMVVKGTKFTAGKIAVVRFTDRGLNQVRSSMTVASDGTFTVRRAVPCATGIRITVTAFEDQNPSGTYANSVETTCP